MDRESSKMEVHSERREPLTQGRSVIQPSRSVPSITLMWKLPKLACV